MNFHGVTFDPQLDGPRLTSQFERVKAYMLLGGWRSLRDIVSFCGGTEASASARLRDFRRKENGSYIVDRRRRGDPASGLFEYRVLPPGQGELAI